MSKNYFPNGCTRPAITCVYRIHCVITNKNYIGSTNNFKRRIKKHKDELKAGMHKNLYLQRAYTKYGMQAMECFIEEVFDNTITKEDLHKAEKEYIEKYKALDPNFGYNLSEVDAFPKTISVPGKQNMIHNIESRKIKVYAINMKTGIVFKLFNSIAEAAKFFNTSTSNISRNCRGFIHYIKDHIFVYEHEYDPAKSYVYIKSKKVVSEATKNKMRIHSPKGKSILQIDANGNVLQEFSSRKYCEEILGFKKEFLRNKIPYSLGNTQLIYKNQ